MKVFCLLIYIRFQKNFTFKINYFLTERGSKTVRKARDKDVTTCPKLDFGKMNYLCSWIGTWLKKGNIQTK